MAARRRQQRDVDAVPGWAVAEQEQTSDRPAVPRDHQRQRAGKLCGVAGVSAEYGGFGSDTRIWTLWGEARLPLGAQ
jgi:hypothetical protein